MPTPQPKPKRRWWTPRFSVRTLAIVVTLVCLYFGCWEMTERFARGQPELAEPFQGDVNGFIILGVESPAPFIVSDYGWVLDSGGNVSFRQYHVWFLGFKAKIWSEYGSPL